MSDRDRVVCDKCGMEEYVDCHWGTEAPWVAAYKALKARHRPTGCKGRCRSVDAEKTINLARLGE